MVSVHEDTAETCSSQKDTLAHSLFCWESNKSRSHGSDPIGRIHITSLPSKSPSGGQVPLCLETHPPARINAATIASNRSTHVAPPTPLRAAPSINTHVSVLMDGTASPWECTREHKWTRTPRASTEVSACAPPQHTYTRSMCVRRTTALRVC